MRFFISRKILIVEDDGFFGATKITCFLTPYVI